MAFFAILLLVLLGGLVGILIGVRQAMPSDDLGWDLERANPLLPLAMTVVVMVAGLISFMLLAVEAD